MTPEALAAEVLKSLNQCRARMAAIEKSYSNPESRRTLHLPELTHELALLSILERLASGQKPPSEQGTSHWDLIRNPKV